MLVLATCVGFSLVFPAWPGAPVNSRLWYADVPASKVEALRAAVAVVPEDAPVSATNKAASHLSARRYVYTVPTLGRAEWIVLDTSDTWIPEIVAGRENPELLREFLRRVETSAEWGKVLERDGVFAFRRVPARGSAP